MYTWNDKETTLLQVNYKFNVDQKTKTHGNVYIGKGHCCQRTLQVFSIRHQHAPSLNCWRSARGRVCHDHQTVNGNIITQHQHTCHIYRLHSGPRNADFKFTSHHTDAILQIMSISVCPEASREWQLSLTQSKSASVHFTLQCISLQVTIFKAVEVNWVQMLVIFVNILYTFTVVSVIFELYTLYYRIHKAGWTACLK